MSRSSICIACFLAAGAFSTLTQAVENLPDVLALDGDCSNEANDGQSCNLQLLQVKEKSMTTKGKGGKGAGVTGAGCGYDVSRFNYARPDVSFQPSVDCYEGAINSPINIFEFMTTPGHDEPLDYEFQSQTDQVVINNGHNLEVDGDFGSIWMDEVQYDVVQFHIHANAEHTINGMMPAMEMHIVCADKDGHNAVVGILFDVGVFTRPNRLIGQMLKDIPVTGCANNIGTVDLDKDFSKQLNGPFWTYNGSLTTPPCTQEVKWNVMKRRSTISLSQLWAFRKQAFGHPANNRPVQPVNGRPIYLNNPGGIFKKHKSRGLVPLAKVVKVASYGVTLAQQD